MPLVDRPFAETFSFGRSRPAPYRDAAGELAEAAAGVPRFDHDEEGGPRGLLVDFGDRLGQGDRIRVSASGWSIVGRATVFHAFTDPEGNEQLRAVYSLDARATVDGMLGAAGHHREIGAIPGFLKDRGGFVRYRERDWRLPIGLGPDEDLIFSDADDPDRPMLEG